MALSGKDLGALVGQLGADTSDWDRAFTRMERNMKQAERNADRASKRMSQAFNKAGKRMSQMGRSLTTRVTLPLIGIGGASLKMAADFDTSLRKVTGLVGVASEEVDKMRGRVLELSGETARAPQELADALFFVTSAGLRGSNALDVLEASAKASAAGLGDTATVADLVTSAVNAYGAENLNAAKATDILVGAVREGKAEAPALASSLGQVLPIASNLGVSFDQVGAAVAAMTRTGTDAATASVQLRQILASLLKPTSQAEEAMKGMGTSSAELRKTLREDGLIAVLSFMKDQMTENEQAMAQVFPNIRALSGALDLMGSSAEDTVGIFNRMQDTTGLTETAFESAQGPAFKFQQALAKLKTAAVNLGTVLFPVFEEMINIITPLLDKLASLETKTLKWGIAIGGLTALAGPFLIALGMMAKSMAVLITIAFSKFALIAGVFTSVVVAGQWMVDNWDKIAKGMEVAFQTIEMVALTAMKGIVSAVEWMIRSIINSTPAAMLTKLFGIDQGEMATSILGFEEAIDMVQETIEEKQVEMFNTLAEFNNMEFGGIGESAVNAFQKSKDMIIAGLSGLLEDTQISSLMDDLMEMLSGAGGGTGGGGGVGENQSAGNNVIGEDLGTGGTMEYFRKFAANFADGMTQMVGTAEEGASKIPASLQEIEKASIDMSDALQSSITNAVTSFATSIGEMIGAGLKGGNFFDMLLKMVADFAVQFGQLVVAMGVAALNLASIIVNPIGAIIAGGALIALGSAMKALVKKGPSGSSSGSAESQSPSARTVGAENEFQVDFRIGNDALVGTLQKKNKRDRRVGRVVNLGGS